MTFHLEGFGSISIKSRQVGIRVSRGGILLGIGFGCPRCSRLFSCRFGLLLEIAFIRRIRVCIVSHLLLSSKTSVSKKRVYSIKANP